MSDQQGLRAPSTRRKERLVRFRRRIDSGVLKTYAWRFGPISGLRCEFSFGGFVESLHVGRLAVARGGEDPITEGFVDGVKAHWLKSSYPQIVVSWWPAKKNMPDWTKEI